MQESYMLCEVDEHFIEGSGKLNQISSDKGKVECLQCLYGNWELVLWIEESFLSKPLILS